MTIYIERLLLDNLAMNALLLWCAGRLIRTQGHWWRIGLAALLGGVYAVVTIGAPGDWLAVLPLRILCSGVMVYIAFGWGGRRYWKIMGMFYLVTFLFAGVGFGVFSMLGGQFSILSGGFYLQGIPLWILAGACMLAIFLIRWATGIYRQNLVRGAHHIQIRIGQEGRYVECMALTDSGSSLVEPLSGDAAIVMEYQTLKDILPQAVRQAIESEDWEASDQTKLRGIPYHALGEKGLLPGWLPQMIALWQKGRWIQVSAYLAIYTGVIDDIGEVHALLPPVLLKAIKRNEGSMVGKDCE